LTISWGIAVADMTCSLSYREAAKRALAGYKSIEGETYIIIVATKKEQS
jgi:hypothetical protein